MFARFTLSARRRMLAATAVGLSLLAVGLAAIPTARGQDQGVPTARAVLGPPAYVPVGEQPPARIVVDAPLPDQLAKGIAVVQFQTENLRISPVFGHAALAVSPRIGHLHVTLDDKPWLWAHFSDQELILGGLTPGQHKLKIELVNAAHKTLAASVVPFTVPARDAAQSRTGSKPLAEQPRAQLLLDAPEPDLLAKGVAFIRYQTKNVQIAPVFGPAAVAVSPRIGHLRVSVDNAPWHWVDASGQPVDVGYLPPGPHQILIELVNANGELLDQHVVKVEVPQR